MTVSMRPCSLGHHSMAGRNGQPAQPLGSSWTPSCLPRTSKAAPFHSPAKPHAVSLCSSSTAQPATFTGNSPLRCSSNSCRSLLQRQACSPPRLLPNLPSHIVPHRGFQPHTRSRTSLAASPEVDILLPLGLDFLTFLAAIVLVIPVFKSLKISPVLGFLFSGLMLQQLGLFQDLEEIETLSELGVLFLLFEMGLELSLDRLKALAKYAFGLGSLQILFCVSIFTAFALPAGNGFGTQFLTTVAHAPVSLVSIRSPDEAVVIAAALSMSSSAFVLQLLSERGELTTRFGSATLGVLLFQDIAVVPFLVLLPVITSGHGSEFMAEAKSPDRLLLLLGPTILQTVGGLGVIFLGDKLILKRIFAMVAASRSPETFVALCLLTVAGTSLLTQKLGFSDTLGAFIAGVLLSETSYRTQIEADIRPFKGLLLGLFFVSVGASVNMAVLQASWQEAFWILAGLLVVKVSVITGLGRIFGLSRSESIKTGFILSQGGEFAFVLLSLANQLSILPEDLNQLLIIVVVASMALTPGLAELGQTVADWLDKVYEEKDAALIAANGGSLGSLGLGSTSSMASISGGDSGHGSKADPIVICGFSAAGQMVANMLESPLAASGSKSVDLGYIAFDLDPVRVSASRKAGFDVVFGDGTRAAVLQAAGVERPKAVVICYADKDQALRAVHSIRMDFPTVRLFACAADLRHAAELEEAGADAVVIRSVEAGLALGAHVLEGLGTFPPEVEFLRKNIGSSVAMRTHLLADKVRQKGEQAVSAGAVDILLTGAEMYRSGGEPGSRTLLDAETGSGKNGRPAADWANDDSEEIKASSSVDGGADGAEFPPVIRGSELIGGVGGGLAALDPPAPAKHGGGSKDGKKLEAVINGGTDAANVGSSTSSSNGNGSNGLVPGSLLGGAGNAIVADSGFISDDDEVEAYLPSKRYAAGSRDGGESGDHSVAVSAGIANHGRHSRDGEMRGIAESSIDHVTGS